MGILKQNSRSNEHGNEKQSGLVSIVVTSVIVLILTFILVAFSQLVRREQRQTIDRQLATQAFFAAESGVNDAVKALRDDNRLHTEKFTDSCDGFTTAALRSRIDPNLDDSGNIAYSCLFVNPSGPTIEYDNVATSESKVFPVKVDDDPSSPELTKINFKWHKSGLTPPAPPLDFSGPCPAINNFPSLWPAGCDAGILRIDIIPYDSPKNRDDFINKTFTAFLIPKNGGPVPAIHYLDGVGDRQGIVESASCDTSIGCEVNIQLIPGRTFWVRAKTIYTIGSRLVVTGTDSAGNPLELLGAQFTIDSTGRAGDILRRIQVRISVDEIISGDSDKFPFPEYVIQTSDSFCKRLNVTSEMPPKIEFDSIDPACERPVL